MYHNISSHFRSKHIVQCLALFCLVGLSACATVPRERVYNDFVIVKVEEGDDFSSLAAKYLNDPQKGWVISEFNDVAFLAPGQELVIPLGPFIWGGLKAHGYQTVPILTYYGFSKNKTDEQTVSETNFKEQMQYLKDNGYRVIGLDQFLDFLDFKTQIPEKSVVITFDDGRRSLYDIAFPVLKDYGFRAVLFIRTDFIGGKDAVSWEQLREMAENGFDIQSKAKTHRDMTRLNKGESFEEYFKAVQMEIVQSKQIIEKRLNHPCQYLAYPYGKSNHLVSALLKKEGFRAAFTLAEGGNPFYVDRYLINRSVVHGGWDLARFKASLSIFHKSELK